MRLILLLWAVGAAPVDSRAVDDLIDRVPGAVTSATAPAVTTVDGVPVIQRSVVSKMRVDDLKSYFVALFKKQALYLAPEQDNFKPEKGDQITGVDTENLLSYTVILQPSNQLTTVIVAQANLGKPKMVKSSDAIAPVFPGATNITSYRIETTQGMTYATTATPAEIKNFYREVMGKMGFTASEDVVFTKGQLRLSVTVAVGVSERNVSVYMQTTPDGSAPPPLPPALRMLPSPDAPAEPAPAPAKPASKVPSKPTK